MDKSLLPTLLPFAVIGLVLIIRIRRMNKERPLDLRRIWILPVLICALAYMTFASMPPDRQTMTWATLALVAGGALGWLRGKTIAIHRDPATGQLMQKPSIVGVVLVLAILAVKYGLRTYMGVDPAHTGTKPDPAIMMFTDILIAFAVGLLVATQAELTLRARRLIGGM